MTHLDPKSCAFAERGQLRRLEVSPAEDCLVLLLFGEFGETLDDNGQLGNDDVAGVTQEDQVGVVCNVARGGTQVNDGSCGWAVLSENVDVCHDIVAALLLLYGSFSHLGVIEFLRHNGRYSP